jgi:hypothetical protein
MHIKEEIKGGGVKHASRAADANRGTTYHQLSKPNAAAYRSQMHDDGHHGGLHMTAWRTPHGPP